MLRDLQLAARAIGLQIQPLRANTNGEIDAAFATVERERPDALFIASSAYFTSRRVQLVLTVPLTLLARADEVIE